MSKKPTPTQIAKARYDEARHILEAWTHRLAVAQANVYNTNKHGGDILAARRNLNAVEIHREDAKADEAIARQQWVTTANKEIRAAA
ncbi:hypothetical protein [Paenarthrobacter sp. YJN-5]|uniref:hypothetical protein n=1 Tax=Paenarthrobacter sp. YJN-5 TaxID=2735316 RepID=UPI001877CB21|nr:hypothetical protein [Paenarthrobacter sp. YJN-5]QOT15907.1 hypothetical protein HMI59_04415 [Paenarthrobacter sp. YJN-5]